jgi:Domain of unknown function (DUF4129)
VSRGSARWLAALIALPGLAPGIGRRAAQQLARRELARSIYQPSVGTRILRWLGRVVDDLLNAGTSLPGGWWSTIALLVVLVLLIAAVTFWIRPPGPSRLQAAALMSGTLLSARDHRELAELHAAEGDYSAAIIDRLRAIAAGIEERGLLPARPGRTADELAAQAGRVLPELASELAAVALLFDDVRYGGRVGTASGYESACQLDARVLAAKAARSGDLMPAGTAQGDQT